MYQIKASFPGRIIAFPLAPGDKVEVGTLVLLVECMKTMYDIVSERSGTFKSYNGLKVNEEVEEGQILAEIEEA